MHMRKLEILFAVLCFLYYSRVSAQNEIILTPIDIRNSITLDDLWNMTISVTRPTNFISFYITLDVKGAENNALVNVESAQFPLQQGVLTLSPVNLDMLQPVKANYSSSEFFSNTLQNGGYFPSGTYRVIYTLYGIAHDPYTGTVTEKMTTVYFTKSVELFYPPMLLEPFNGEELKNNQSVFFTWTPAMGNNTSITTYTIRIAEVLKGMTASEALSSSTQFYFDEGISETYINYPPEATGFIEDTLYAWQVAAFFDNTNPVYSEYFTFTYHNPQPNPNINTSNVRIKNKLYAEPRPWLDGGYAIVFDTLRFVYNEIYSVQSTDYLLFKIFNKKHEQVLLPSQTGNLNITTIQSPNIVKGTNYISLPVNLANLPKNEYYILELSNVKKERWLLRFLIAGDNIPYAHPHDTNTN